MYEKSSQFLFKLVFLGENGGFEKIEARLTQPPQKKQTPYSLSIISHLRISTIVKCSSPTF